MSKNETRITHSSEVTETVVDYTTGEIVSESRTETYTKKVGKEPPYVKLYLDHLSRFKGLQLSLNPILAQLLQKTSYADENDPEGGMILYLNKPLKSDIAKKCGLSLTRVDHAVTQFVKKGYMRRLDLGKYQFNAHFFGKGEWKDIENIRATFDYGTGEAVADIVKKEESAINTMSDEIVSQSLEELNELKKMESERLWNEIYGVDNAALGINEKELLETL